MKNQYVLRFVAILLCLVMLLAACGGDDQPTSPQETQGTTVPTAQLQNEATEPTEDAFPTNPITYEVIQPAQGDFVIAYPKNCNFSLYGDTAGFPLNFNILSRRAIDMNSISADAIGTDSETYRVSDITDQQDYNTVADTNLDYPAYIYQTQQGIDWLTAGQLYLNHTKLSDAMHGRVDTEAHAAAVQAWEEYETYAAQYLEGYEEEKETLYNNCPYYHYCVSFSFQPGSEEETINTIRIEAEGQIYDLPIGEIRLYPSLQERLGLPESDPFSAAFNSHWAYTWLTPWSTGRYIDSFDFTVDEDVVLKRLELVTDNGSVMGDINIYQHTASGQSINIDWDGNSDIYLDADDEVILQISMYDPNMAGLANYCTMTHYVLHYTTEAGENYATFALGRYTDQSYFDWCAIYLDGLDLRSYYIHHYNVNILPNLLYS